MSESAAIVARNLSRQVEDTEGMLTILDGVDFAIPKGQTAAITGSSGSGKSTLLGLLAGLDMPSSGSVHMLGHDLSVLDEDSRARLRAATWVSCSSRFSCCRT